MAITATMTPRIAAMRVRDTAMDYPAGDCLHIDQTALDRVANQLRSAREPELLLDVCAVRLDGADAEIEPLGDLVVRMAQGDQAQDLHLAVGEVVGRGRVGLGRQARPQLRL